MEELDKIDEITLEIDGREVKAREGMTILEAAKSVGINIPTLCYHPALTPFGACRICSVEIVQRGRSRIVTSCVYPVEEGLVVRTKSDRVISDRKMLIELMLACAPKAKVIQDLAHEYGVERTRLKIEDEENLCILCGLCARICEERMGRSAISFVGRGIDRKIDTPFHIQTEECMACGACAFVCPTGAIKLEEIHLVRKSGGKSGTYIANEHKGGRGRGQIVAVCLSQKKESKKPVNQGLLKEDYGFVGDMHAGSARQVSLLAIETVNKMLSALESINPDRMRSQDIKINPGDSAENLLTEGIDLMSLHIGTRIYIGKEAILEVTQLGKAFHRPGFYLLPLEGVFARVVQGGVVKPGDNLTAQLNGM
ncbi:unnamed protein product [marine sediment metagenome]|uniref:2Fe-2S ferredoxin-type domain-containing protein n=1 Tax=marine sediment metagenome TaxID=412755 RepID=X1KF88_9ZZZZ